MRWGNKETGNRGIGFCIYPEVLWQLTWGGVAFLQHLNACRHAAWTSYPSPAAHGEDRRGGKTTKSRGNKQLNRKFRIKKTLAEFGEGIISE